MSSNFYLLTVDHKTIFNFFNCFEPEVYYSSLATVIAISLIISASKRRINTFFESLWTHTSALLSQSVLLPSNTAKDRLLSGLWLISCTVLLAAFAGLFRDLLIRKETIEWIDSLRDLYQWNDIQIKTFESDYIDDLINDYPNDSMAINFQKRVELLDYSMHSSPNVSTYLDYHGVVRGRFAIVADLEFLHIEKTYLIENLSYIEDVDFHVSRLEEISTPGFIASNRFRLKNSMSNILDQV